MNRARQWAGDRHEATSSACVRFRLYPGQPGAGHLSPINGQPIALFRATGSDWKLIDPGGNTWNFEGCATTGPHTGTCLPRIPYLVDFWFDWYNYHPASDVYRER